MKLFIVIFVSLIVIGCAGEPEQSTKQGDFQVDKLFTHDGITLYRFEDAGEYVYFASKGNVDWSNTVSNGKTSRTEKHNTPTAEESF
jgi:hypothetical protein